MRLTLEIGVATFAAARVGAAWRLAYSGDMNRIRFGVIAALAVVACHVGCKSDPASTSSGASGPSGQTATPAAPATGAAPSAAPHAGTAARPGDHGSPPANVAARTLEKLPDGRRVLGPFSLQVPADWIEKPSTSNMRAAEFKLPAPAGTDAEVIVYHFGESGAGGVDANIDRWVSQFQMPDGSKASRDVAKIEKKQLAGQEVTLVSLSGRYVAAPPGGGPTVDKADQTLHAAIVPSPRGPYYFRLIGGTSAVQAQAPAFQEALASLKLM